MTLQPPVTHFRIRTYRCSSVSSYQEPQKYSIRPVESAANQVPTTSFGRKVSYVSPLPSPVEDTRAFESVKRVLPTLTGHAASPYFPPCLNSEAEKLDVETPSPRTEDSFSSPTSSFGSSVSTPPPSLVEEEGETPCKSILRRANEEMKERLMTAPGGGGIGRTGTTSPDCISQFLSAFSKKGVRFDVERNSTHTYEKDCCDGVLVNGVKKNHIARHLCYLNLLHRDGH